MITSMRVLVVQPTSHTLPPIMHPPTMTTTLPLKCIPALLASAHSVLCNAPLLPKNLLCARSLATLAIPGRQCIFSVRRRFLVYLVALQLGSVFWCASHFFWDVVAVH